MLPREDDSSFTEIRLHMSGIGLLFNCVTVASASFIPLLAANIDMPSDADSCVYTQSTRKLPSNVALMPQLVLHWPQAKEYKHMPLKHAIAREE
jgi:hypothetical protein